VQEQVYDQGLQGENPGSVQFNSLHCRHCLATDFQQRQGAIAWILRDADI
jgi:hypothetical protein